MSLRKDGGEHGLTDDSYGDDSHDHGDDDTGGGLYPHQVEEVEDADEATPLVSSSRDQKNSNNNNKWKKAVQHHQHATYWQKLTASEHQRRRALQCSHVGAAAFLIRDAFLTDSVENPADGAYDPYSASPDASQTELLLNTVSMLCQRWCTHRWLLRILRSAIGLLVVLTFLEPPHWCRLHNEEYGGCEPVLSARGEAIAMTDADAAGEQTSSRFLGKHGKDEDNFVEYYPNTGSMWLTIRQSRLIEACCVAIIITVVLLRIGRDGMSLKRYLRKGAVRRDRIIQLVCLFLLCVGLVLDTSFTETYTRLHPFYRLFLLISFLGGSQREIGVLVHMLPDVVNILLLLFVLMLFYAWFGVVMFVATEEGRQHFPNLVEGMWTLWICVTTANYPDVMMPAYNDNRWVALYFVSFMGISFFFLMNVILAQVVNEYNDAMQRRRDEHADMTKTNLTKAYQLLTQEEGDRERRKSVAKGGNDEGNDAATSGKNKSNSNNNPDRIDRQTVMDLFTILNQDFPEFRTLSDDDTKLLFAILDKDGSSTISEEEFMDFGNVLMLEFVKKSDYATFIEVHFPRFFHSNGWQLFCRIVRSVYFESAIDVILVLNAVVVSIQTYPELSGQSVRLDPKVWDGSIDTVWEQMETVFTVIYVLEAMSKIAVFGWRRYSERPKNMFDFSITVLAVFSSAVVYYPNEYSDSRLIRMIITARVLRLLRLLMALKQFQLIGMISAEILPAAKNVIIVLFLALYFFAALGMMLYGGLITRDPDNSLSHLLLNTDFSDSDYWANNFNDMISGMNVLFNLLVVNNWYVCEVGFEAATKGKWVRLFFLAFHILGVILINNLVIAFVIDSFFAQLAVFRERTGEEVIDGGETVLERDYAVFDATQVTGTKTSLKGDYIARLRHGNTDMGDDMQQHREKLRKLFSRSSSSNVAQNESAGSSTSLHG